MENKVEIKLGDKTFEIGYPNIGQYVKIEALKQSLTDGRYAIIAFGALKTGTIALDYLDACIYFGVIEPKILKHFGVEEVKSLVEKPTHTPEMKELLDQYTNVYSPFFDSIEIRTDRLKIPQTILEQEKSDAKVQ
jgi:hypothetical protein